MERNIVQKKNTRLRLQIITVTGEREGKKSLNALFLPTLRQFVFFFYTITIRDHEKEKYL